jgi:hypothetical protein
MNSIQINKKNNITETSNANFFEGSLHTEIGDKALCRSIKKDYNDFNKLDLQSKYELSKNHLKETLDLLITEYRKGYVLDDFTELEEFLTTYSYNYKFTPEHLKNCDCYKAVCNRFMDLKYLENKINEAQGKGKGYKIDMKNPAERLAFKNKYENATNDIYLDSANYLNKYYFNKDKIRICPYLFKELVTTLSFFKKDYDLSKTKVREVVKSIINYQISLYNSNVYSASNGMFDSVSDKFGNMSNRISSNEYYKMKLNEQIIKAIKTLDEMIEGNKNVNINMDVKSISLKDVLKRIDI